MEGTAAVDLHAGIAVEQLVDGALLQGRVGSKQVVLARHGNEYFAVGALCTHYHAALAKGLIVDDTVRCPMHHACFSLRTGEALYAPALDPIPTWRVEVVAGKVCVREMLKAPGVPSPASRALRGTEPQSVVIVGGGGAGLAAADMLRREGYSGPVTLVSADDSPPYDRPNVSKDYLAGTAPEAWMPLRNAQYYAAREISLVLSERVMSIDATRRAVSLSDGRQIDYGALLLATGADPIQLPIPATEGSRIYCLRTLSDARAIIAAAVEAKTAVVVGASFIGLEAAASLRTRGIAVHVVGLEEVPLERVLGREVGRFLRGLHESHGVIFHLKNSVSRVDGRQVTLSDGKTLDADFVLLGVGVRPSIALAEQAGLAVDRGVTVDEFLETSAPGVFAAGDIARWPDVHSGDRIRVEHWVVAQRQGQVAARNILGQRQPFTAVPFFWSQHYELAINYVGHAESFDSAAIDGSLDSHDCEISYLRGGRILAAATISRDLRNLQVERQLEGQRSA
jgi:NADPH-dependent 2,4-dienoyl-CoA reductase/sulfur reductase-like enzyme/nitrite reductase/ring-hydroxylating ferredoxin subunit